MKKQLFKKIGVAGLCMSMTVAAISTETLWAAPEKEEQIQEHHPPYPYYDTTLSFEERATDLVSRMTLDEKISQMGNKMDAIPRLGVKDYNLWSEGIHGIWNLKNGCTENTTSFPTSIAVSCSWNPELYQKEASMISDEARGLTALHGAPLSYWSPTINLSRDPRWGRNDEGYGEDPFLTTKMGGAFVTGMQGDNEEGYLKTISTIKHFAANNSEGNRFNGSADMDDRDLYEYYTRAFKDITEQYHPQSVMTSYNAINGTPNTVNKELVTTDLRDKWGFDGYVTSDDQALYFTYNSQRWSSGEGIAPSGYDTAQAALKAGVDTACSSGEYKRYCKQLIQDGVISEADVDRAVIRVFTERMATGEFDEGYGPYGTITGEEIEAKDHEAMALDMARESIVMLKNEDKTLPLDVNDLDGKKVAVIGEFGKRLELGGYSGHPSVKKTFYDGIEDALKDSGAEILYDKGISNTANQKPYLFNLDWLEINYDDGKEPLKIEAENYASQNGGVIVEKGETLGNIADGCYTVYPEVDLNHMSKLKVSAAGHPTQAAGGQVELRVNSPTGPVMVSVKVNPTTGWQEYQTFEGVPDALNYDTPQDIYVVYKSNTADHISESAMELAKSADVVLLSVGTSHDSLCKEGKDRVSVKLPYYQEEMIAEVARAVKKADPNKPVILQINAVGMVGVEAFEDDVDAMIWSGYNGQAQGTAAADVIFGKVNPSGRLSFTWYEDDNQIPNIYDYHLRNGEDNLGRTYMYSQGKASYPFGYGLSYTDFEYSNLKVDKSKVTPDDTFTVSVDVKNTGKASGKETVQLYVATPNSPKEMQRPAKRLKGFQKVALEPGEKKTVSIKVDASDLYFWDEENACQTFDQGEYEIQVGHSSLDIRETANVTMEGQASVELKHARLDSDKFILEQGETAQTQLSIAMSDETFADPNSVNITYASNRPEVATVDSAGVVTAVGNGTALITATVSKDGKQVTSNVAVTSRMSTELDNILLDGVSLMGFVPEKKDYAITWPKNQELPEVTAEVKEGLKCEVIQPTEETRKAEIHVVDEDETVTYTVSFGKQSGMISDEFTEDTFNPVWNVEHENKNGYQYKPGEGLTVTVEKGDLYQNQNNAKNLILQDSDGDWTVETKVELSEELSARYQQAGLVVYSDDDNFIKIDYEYSDGNRNYIQYSREEKGKRNYQSLGELDSVTDIYFKIVKKGNQYTGFYSLDGKNFVQQGETITFSGENLKVGMCAFGSDKPVDATFKYFRVTSEAYDTVLAQAYDAVKRADYTDVMQKDAPTEEAVKQHVLDIAKAAVTQEGIDVQVDTVSYAPAEGTNAGKYEFTVSVTKDGNTVNGVVKAIAILPDKIVKNIKTITSLPDRTVPFGTLKEELDLPAQVEAVFDDGSVDDVNVVWSCEDYRADQAGTYEFIGEIVDTEAYQNPENITAQLKVTVADQEVQFYDLIVENGSGSGQYAAGETVEIVANTALEGQMFDQWIGEEGVEIADVSKATTTIIMPEKATKVKAVYKDVAEDPKNPGEGLKPDGKPKPQTKVPKTGDNTGWAIWGMVAVVSLGLGTLVLARRKKAYKN